MGKRDSFIDIVKGIGILSIVIGHSSWRIFNGKIPIGPFVYTYHMMIFFFVAGFCFSSHNAENVEFYIGKRIRKMLSLYFMYECIFVALHNLFLKMKLISGDPYDIRRGIECIGNAVTARNSETLLGAMWFVPMLLISNIFFCLFFDAGRRYSKWVHFAATVSSGAAGLYLCTCNVSLNYSTQLSLLAIPIMYAGYLFKVYRSRMEGFFTWFGCVLSAVLLFFILNHTDGKIIELSVNHIISPILFYPVTFVGIYFCISLSRIITHVRFLNTVFAYIGKNSFHIMALHLLSFKLVDCIYGLFAGIKDVETLSLYPHSFSLEPVYYTMGVALPLGFVLLSKKVGRIISRRRVLIPR